MPSRPDLLLLEQDRRLDPYRDRVAVLRRDGVDVGHLLVQVEPWSEVTAGHFWWRRWSRPVEVPHLTVTLPGASSDQYIPAEAIRDQLQEWDNGLYEHYGERLEACWLDREASLRAWPEKLR